MKKQMRSFEKAVISIICSYVWSLL